MGTREPQKGFEWRSDSCIGKTPLADAWRFQVELLIVVPEDDDNTRTYRRGQLVTLCGGAVEAAPHQGRHFWNIYYKTGLAC